MCFKISPQIVSMNPCWLYLIFLHYVFSNVSSLWEYFDLQGPWRKVLTDLKKSLYTLQADPEKSRDFMLKNPGILIDWKSRDPGIPGIPLGPGVHWMRSSCNLCKQQKRKHSSIIGTIIEFYGAQRGATAIWHRPPFPWKLWWEFVVLAAAWTAPCISGWNFSSVGDFAAL